MGGGQQEERYKLARINEILEEAKKVHALAGGHTIKIVCSNKIHGQLIALAEARAKEANNEA